MYHTNIYHTKGNMHAVDILIPSWNNYEYLAPCLQSILRNKAAENLFHVYVINNGHKKSCDWINSKDVTVFTPGDNLGWEGGLKYALERTSAPYVLFLNDDTFIPMASKFWLNNLLQPFVNEEIGAVGPSSNVVMGFQNIFRDTLLSIFSVKLLIGFCFLVKRSALVEAGGVDDSLPGGDDFDLSIRLREKGYKLVCDKEVFVYHHGFKTGTRINGDERQKGGWNSCEMQEKTDMALIRKHGFAKWWDCKKGAYILESPELFDSADSEGNIIRKYITGEVILDLGCGGNKTVPNAIGVDMVSKDDVIETLQNATSQADIVADVSQELPFEQNSVDTIIARHILEHLMDSVTILRHWAGLLRRGGRLIIAVPDNKIIKSIPMNIEHCHGFSKESIKSLLELCGFKVLDQLDGGNHISFITIAEKI